MSETCRGCGRTRNEIANWLFMTQSERARIMEECLTREIDPESPAHAQSQAIEV